VSLCPRPEREHLTRNRNEAPFNGATAPRGACREAYVASERIDKSPEIEMKHPSTVRPHRAARAAKPAWRLNA